MPPVTHAAQPTYSPCSLFCTPRTARRTKRALTHDLPHVARRHAATTAPHQTQTRTCRHYCGTSANIGYTRRLVVATAHDGVSGQPEGRTGTGYRPAGVRTRLYREGTYHLAAIPAFVRLPAIITLEWARRETRSSADLRRRVSSSSRACHRHEEACRTRRSWFRRDGVPVIHRRRRRTPMVHTQGEITRALSTQPTPWMQASLATPGLSAGS